MPYIRFTDSRRAVCGRRGWRCGTSEILTTRALHWLGQGSSLGEGRRLYDAYREELGKYEVRTDEIFEIVKNQREY